MVESHHPKGWAALTAVEFSNGSAHRGMEFSAARPSPPTERPLDALSRSRRSSASALAESRPEPDSKRYRAHLGSLGAISCEEFLEAINRFLNSTPPRRREKSSEAATEHFRVIARARLPDHLTRPKAAPRIESLAAISKRAAASAGPLEALHGQALLQEAVERRKTCACPP